MQLFRNISDILNESKNNIFNAPLSEAMKSIQKTVKQLVANAELPDEIANRFVDYGEYEYMLYSAEYYRDHFFHPFHVFLLGYLLLGKLQRLSINTPENHPFFISGIPDAEDFLRKWLIVSLWHDITYAATKGPDWLSGFIDKKLHFKIRVLQDWGPILSSKHTLAAVDTLCKISARHQKKGLLSTLG